MTFEAVIPFLLVLTRHMPTLQTRLRGVARVNRDHHLAELIKRHTDGALPSADALRRAPNPRQILEHKLCGSAVAVNECLITTIGMGHPTGFSLPNAAQPPTGGGV